MNTQYPLCTFLSAPSWKKPWNLACGLLLAMVCWLPMHAQISYTQAWNTAGNLGGWTFSSGAVDNTGTPCEGANGARRNFGTSFSTTTWTLTSPNLAPPQGNSGQPVTVTFQFKRTGSGQFNFMRSAWSTNNSTWTNVPQTVSNQSCNTYTMTFTPTPAVPVYIRLEASRNATFSSVDYLFDNVSVTQAAPICPAATATVVENCANGNYSVQFNVTSIGNGGSLAYSVNGVSQAPLSIPATGTYTIGPFPTTQQVNYTLTNSLSTTVCGSVTGARWSTCPVNITCGTTLNVQHCYTNNDDRSFHFVAPPGETITLDFVAGTMGSGDVIRAYSGGDDTGTPIGSLTGNYANLPGVGGMSMSNELYLEVESNASGSCSDGQQTSWQFEVKCTPACTSPDGAVSPITNCTASNYSLNVEVISTGDEPTTTLWYSVDGGPPQTIPGLVEWNIQPIGPFPLTSSVNVRLLHATQNSCDRNLGNFTRDQLCPPANELCGQATQLFVKTPAQCPGEATNGTTFDANNEIAAPTCNGTGGTIRDVWYRFNSGFNQSPIQIAIAAGTIGHWGVELYSACGGTPISCTTGSPAAVNLSGATAFTDYWVRVLTNTSLGAMGTFSICVSATPQPSSCGNTIQDPGGAANYPNNANVTTTYCPANPGEVLTMTFTQFSVESGFGDELKVYNGPSSASPLAGTFSGSSIPAPIVSSHPSGCLTTNFTSGAFLNQAGYTANLTCCIAPPPTVSAGNNGPLCPGVPADLNLTATSNIGTVFSWTGPNGFTSTQQNPTITGAGSTAAGTYTVTARNGASGCPTSATTTVVLNPTISAAATASPAQVCPGGTATLNSLAGYANNYAVSSTPFGLLSGSGTSVVTGDDAVSSAIALPFGFEFFGTTYNQVFAYTNGWLQLGTSSGSTATYSTTLPATAGPNTLIAALWDDLNVTGGGTVTSFTAGTAPNRVFVVSWNNVKFYNAAANDGNATFQIQLFESDMHVEVHIADATDPVASAKTVGVENQTGTVGFTPPGRNNATFSVAPATPEAWAFRRGGTFTYAWTPSALVNSPAAASTTTAALTSTTTFSVVVSDGTCSVTRTADVTVGTGIASAAISPAVPPAICAGGSVTLTASGTGGVPPYTYVWSPGGETTASINATAAGAYSCVVTDQCGTSATAPAVTVVVVTPPTTASAGAPQAICTNGSAVLAANAPVNGTGAWSMVSGPSTSLAQFSSLSASNATFTPAGGAGTYTLRWTISNAPCTASTSDVVITVNVSPGNPTVGTSSLAICQGGTVPSGQGLSATCPTVGQAGSTPFPGSNFISEGATITTRATVTVPALPAGAVVTAARLRLTNVVAANNILGSAQRQNIRVALSGAYTLAEVQLTTATGPGTVSPDPVITLAGFPASGGTINLRTRQTTDNLFTNPDATIGSAVIEVDYTMPSQVRWYNAPTAGTLVFTGGLFDPVGQGAVNNTVPGSTTFHATCGFNACEAIRLPATFTVNALPVVTCGGPYGAVCVNGAAVGLTGSPAGGTWSGTGVVGNTFDPSVAGAGTFTLTYTYTDGNTCTNTCTTTITVGALPNAGSNGTLTICAGSTVTAGQLFAALGGSPNGGGSWNPTLAGGGTYTYTVTAAPCTPATATVTVTEQAQPNAGTNGSLTICAGSTVTAGQLFAALGGSPDGGGTWSPTLAGGGTYTYTVNATAPCTTPATATVAVSEQAQPNAGSNGSLTICAGSTVTAGQLFAQLGGTPDGGGSWSPTMAGAGVYTYTVNATAPCAGNATATVTVSEQAQPNAGTNGSLTICAGSTVTAGQLFAALGGSPDGGGTWSPTLAGGGTYTYTVNATAPCTTPATATVAVSEQAQPNAGTNGSLTICAGSTVTAGQLFAQLGGTPDGGGSWSPTLAGAGVYTYTVNATAPCAGNVTATVTVSEQAQPNAGTNGSLTICAGSTVTAGQLFAQLGGTPDGGGSWSPTLAGAGVYTYTVNATAPCTTPATATVTVSEQAQPNAGSNGTLTICINGSATNLFAQLGGTPDATGSWSGPSALSGGNLGTFTPPAAAGVYTYTVAGTAPCANATATVTVSYDNTDTDGDAIIDCLDNCDTTPGQIGDACNDGNPNTVLDVINGSCVCAGQTCTTNLVLEFNTDANSPVQNSWELRASGSGILVQSGSGLPGPVTSLTVNTCLPNGCYYLRVLDSGGDGIANGGYILRTLTGAQRIIDNRNNFTSGSVSAVVGNGGFCLPLGGDKLIYTSCDKLDWMNNQFLVAAENAAVSAQWQVGDQTDDGYQFWIFDPNGTYGYAKFRNHATSDGFGPASATRACHMQINNWSPNQIPANVLMNAKVRSRVNGTNSAWGPVCRFKIDPVRAACPLTKLMDIPGNVNYSCGVTRTWGASSVSKVVARPVDGATQYQFRWRSAELASPVVRTTTTPVLQLNWTPALPNGDYDVEVRVFKNNQWCVTGPAPGAWGDVCRVTIVGSPVGQGMAPQATGSTRAAELAMFPNPNRGDLLTLGLSAVEEGVNTVSVDIYDLTGAVVSSRTIAVNDGMVYQVLDLKEMASGLYMVNITAGAQRYTERLVIAK